MVYMMFSDWAEVSGTYGKVKELIWLLGYNQDPTVNSDYIKYLSERLTHLGRYDDLY